MKEAERQQLIDTIAEAMARNESLDAVQKEFDQLDTAGMTLAEIEAAVYQRLGALKQIDATATSLKEEQVAIRQDVKGSHRLGVMAAALSGLTLLALAVSISVLLSRQPEPPVTPPPAPTEPPPSATVVLAAGPWTIKPGPLVPLVASDPAGATSLEVWVFDADGRPAPDGTQVMLNADQGEVQPEEVQTYGGVARALYYPGAEGTGSVTASVAGQPGQPIALASPTPTPPRPEPTATTAPTPLPLTLTISKPNWPDGGPDVGVGRTLAMTATLTQGDLPIKDSIIEWIVTPEEIGTISPITSTTSADGIVEVVFTAKEQVGTAEIVAQVSSGTVYTNTTATVGPVLARTADGPVRSAPIPQTNPPNQILVLKAGNQVVILGQNPERTWWLVRLPDQRIGWVSKEVVITQGDTGGVAVASEEGPVPSAPSEPAFEAGNLVKLVSDGGRPIDLFRADTSLDKKIAAMPQPPVDFAATYQGTAANLLKLQLEVWVNKDNFPTDKLENQRDGAWVCWKAPTSGAENIDCGALENLTPAVSGVKPGTGDQNEGDNWVPILLEVLVSNANVKPS